MMQITFTGSAEEVRAEMLVLLGINKTAPAPELTVEVAPVEATDDEPKRGRGRPRKFKTDEPEVVEPVAVEPEVVAPEPEVVVEEPAPEPEVVPTPKPEPTPEPEQPTGAPCPGNAQDLMSAAMEIVKGDSGKKIELVKLLQSYGAKTINTLAPEHYAEFWVKVNQL